MTRTCLCFHGRAALRLVSSVCLPVALFFSANAASAGWIDNAGWPSPADQSNAIIDDGTASVPAAQLNGWFFNPNSPEPFPTMSDPAQQWTSDANIALIAYWRSLVSDAGGDPDPQSLSASALALTLQDSPANSPEPHTYVLFLSGLAWLARLRRDNGMHVPLRRPR